MKKTVWLGDGSRDLSSEAVLEFRQSKYYRQPVSNRDLHLAYADKFFSLGFRRKGLRLLSAKLQHEIPIVDKGSACVIGLNSPGRRRVQNKAFR